MKVEGIDKAIGLIRADKVPLGDVFMRAKDKTKWLKVDGDYAVSLEDYKHVYLSYSSEPNDLAATEMVIPVAVKLVPDVEEDNDAI